MRMFRSAISIKPTEMSPLRAVFIGSPVNLLFVRTRLSFKILLSEKNVRLICCAEMLSSGMLEAPGLKFCGSKISVEGTSRSTAVSDREAVPLHDEFLKFFTILVSFL